MNPRHGRGVGPTVLVSEDRDEPPVAGIEVEMPLFRRVEIGLLEHERHPQHAFPEVDGGLPVGSVQRDMMDPLGL
jgi:hypothetical protein